MTVEKKKTDIEILDELLTELRYTAHSFANKISKTPGALYHILNGSNSISKKMCHEIVEEFPQVSLKWLTHGIYPILIEVKKEDIIDKSSFEDIPKTLKNIEKLLIEIRDAVL